MDRATDDVYIGGSTDEELGQMKEENRLIEGLTCCIAFTASSNADPKLAEAE